MLSADMIISKVWHNIGKLTADMTISKVWHSIGERNVVEKYDYYSVLA